MPTPTNAIDVSTSGAVSFNGTAFTGGTLSIANGGTDATSFTQSAGIVVYDGTRLANYAGPQITTGGIHTNTSQPIFSVYLATTVSNVTGDGTNYTVIYDTKLKDQGTNFTLASGTFTAPTTGTYQFNIAACFSGAVAGTNQLQIKLVTTGNTFLLTNGVVLGSASEATMACSWITPMTAADTAVVKLVTVGGSKVVSIAGTSSGQIQNAFSGFLIG